MKFTVHLDDNDRDQCPDTPWTASLYDGSDDSAANEPVELDGAYGHHGYNPASALLVLAGAMLGEVVTEQPALAVIDLHIENTYPSGTVATDYTEIYVRTPDLTTGSTDEDLDDWAADTLLPYTGTGRTDSDDDNDPASYTVTIVASSDPRLKNMTFEFGV